MIPEGVNKNNVDRFLGFEDEYDRHRPEAPSMMVDLLSHYLGRKPELVVDLGSGTGLSSFVWKHHAAQIIGVEPNDDMRGKALDKKNRQSDAGAVTFIPGYSNQLDLEDSSADIITCSQSFHWMEPVSTLREAARVLREGGVFAAYDCDWPPIASWEVEEAFTSLHQKADEIIARHTAPEERANKRNKEEHLRYLRESGQFRFTKEVVFHHKETCDAARYIGLALSQGGVRTVMKLGSDELNGHIEQLHNRAEAYFKDHANEVIFCYRMRLGIK